MNDKLSANNQADLLAGVLDSSLDGIYAFKSERDASGQIVDFIFVVVNRAAEKLVGRTAEQLLGKRMLEMLPGNKTDGLFDAYVKVVESGEPFVTEHYYEHDGLANWYSISATPYGDGFTVSFADITDKMQSSEKLRIANERFELLVAGNASGVWDWDCKTDAVYYSRVFNEMLGYERGGLESTLDAFVSRLHPEDRDRIMAQVVSHIQNQGPYDVEYRLRHKEGHYVWCHAAGQAQWDHDGNPIRMAGSIVDITERKTSEEHFRVLFEMSTDAHLLFDDTGIIDCNQAAVDMLGYDNKQQMLKVHPAELSPELQPDGRRSMEKCIEMDQAARDNGYHRFDWMHRRKDGSDILVEVTLNPVKISGRDTLLVVWHDLTERADAERAVREAADRLNEAQELANIGNWQWTVADNQITWSDQIKRMFGMPTDQPAPSFEDHCKQIHPDDVVYWKSVLDKAAEDLQPYTMTFRNLLPDGTSRVLESRGHCELNEQGELIRTYGTVQDITETEKTRDQLEKLSLVASRTDNGVILTNAEGRVEWVNEAFVEVTGYELDELKGKTPGSILQGPETDPAAIERMRTKLRSGEGYSETLLNYHKNGDPYWIEIEVQPIHDDLGQVTSFMAIARDVTERIAQQQQLQAQQHRLEFALQASRTGLWDWHITSGENYLSDTWYTMLGYEPGELPMRVESWHEITHPEDMKRAQAALADYFSDKTRRYACEIRVRNKAGDWQWVLDVGEAIERDKAGKVTRMIGLHVDIHEQKIAQIELESQQHRLEFALQASRTGLWDWFVKEGTVFYSDTWYTMLGYRPGELPMDFATWEALAHPDDLPRAQQAIDAYLSGQSSRYTCEMRMRNKAGRWQWINTIGEAAERDADGAIVRIVGLHVDIHDQKTAQQELEQARDQAQQANAAKSAFVANMSHEIRTPMNAILGYADLLLDGGQNEADKRNHAQTIRRNGKHLLSIVDDILDLSKIEAGKLSIDQATCSPTELFEGVVNLMAPKASQKGIGLTFKSNGDLPAHLKTDPTRVRQVLINLIGNAIKFTERGEVGLVVKLTPDDEGNATLQCDVTDTGIGITDEQMEQLFRPFSQADESTTRKFGGTGLGLAISTNLCNMLDGKLTCTSTFGEGSTFTATFKVRQVDEAAPAPRSDSSDEVAADLRGKRILIVEDGPDNKRLFKHYVTKAGAEVELADNGETGRDAALGALRAGQAFDVVLMDMQMPVLDGYQATRELRDAGYDLPIIAMTAHASANDRDKCLGSGCSDYLSKPVDRQQLIRTIASHLQPSTQGGVEA